MPSRDSTRKPKLAAKERSAADAATKLSSSSSSSNFPVFEDEDDDEHENNELAANHLTDRSAKRFRILDAQLQFLGLGRQRK